MNKALRRQLRRLGLDAGELPERVDDWQRLLETVGASYDEEERGRYLQERALRISSAEMQRLYEQLRVSSASELRNERDLLRAVFDALDGSLFSVDDAGTIRFANQSAENLLAGSESGVLGKNLADLITLSERDRSLLHILQRRVLVRGLEGQVVGPDGVTIPVSVNVEPLSGESTGSVVVVHDVSDTQQVTEDLLKTRAHLGTVIGRSPIPFYVEDYSKVGTWLGELREQGVVDLRAYLSRHPQALHDAVSKIVILDANPAAYELLEVPTGQSLIGPLDPRLIAEETLAVIEEQVEAIWDDEDTLTTEVDGVKWTGERLIANFHWMAARVNGKLDLSRVIVALTDITQIVLSEERMRELIRSKDHFLASVSHELRTPLTAVTAAASVLDTEFGTLEPAEQKELISILSQESVEMAQIVEDLLVAARADLGSLTVIPEAIRLEQEIHEVVAREASRGHNVRLGDISGWTFADPLRVRQIVRNLVTNALRYGGSEIWIDASVEGANATISVLDDGDGVPEELWASIFEPYEQAHTTPGLPGSVGMGLNVARHLARLMAGDVTYAFEGGVSRFTVTLPATAQPE